MRRPNFFIVGAPRSGTTSLYAYLWQHPEVYVSIHKEPQFFGSDLTTLAGAIREEELYLDLFAGAGDRPRVGEASVWYLMSKKAPSEIHAFAPDAKIIALLRDPVQMAHSLHALYTRSGNEDLPTFEEALAAEPERRRGRRIPPGAYFPEGLIYTDVASHAAEVERYFEVFGRENVHCIVFDDLVRDTAAVYRRTLEFLGIDPGFEAELDPRRAGQRVRILGIRELRRTHPEVRRRMQFDHIKLHDDGPRRPLSAELSARLRELFAEEVARLGVLLDRDLSAWTRGEAERSATAR
ncbi:MAG: sulfotransferase [Acidobacteria bacterium]|nr:sulfotransferase [Acidobacteriota bacterium]